MSKEIKNPTASERAASGAAVVLFGCLGLAIVPAIFILILAMFWHFIAGLFGG